MHETGIVRDLVRRIEIAARDAGARRVVGATVWLGALSQFSAAHFREHFDDESRGTLAANARLDIELSSDVRHPNAQSVVMQSLELDLPDGQD